MINNLTEHMKTLDTTSNNFNKKNLDKPYNNHQKVILKMKIIKKIIKMKIV